MKKFVVFAFIGILVASAVTLRAQQLVPRTVLIEEGTNWSCGPCAQVNPFLEAFIESKGDSIIHIAYHPNWPGADDPMYLNDAADNQGRVQTYYRISGVPTVEVDGKVAQNASTDFEDAFRARVTKWTPIMLSMTRSQVGQTVTVKVTVTAVGDVSSYRSLKLRVAAVERYVDTTGPNGEKRYVNPLREMMPDLNGTALSLQLATPQTFTFTYDINESYRPEKMYEVAFVQSDDATKEVLQASSTLESISVGVKQAELPVQVLSTPNASLNMQVRNSTPEDLTFSAVYLPSVGKDWTVTINGQGSLSMPLKAGAMGDIQLGVTQGTSAYTSGVVVVSTITNRGDTLISPYPVKFIAPDVKIAFVDLMDSTKSVPTLKTMTAMNLRFVPMTDVEATTVSAWKASTFSTIILEGNKWIITGSNKAAVSDYLQSGGHLLVHGGEIAFGLADPASTADDIDETFLSDVLHATYLKDIAATKTVHGVASDPITNGFAASTISVFAVNTDNPIQPDVIAPANGATPIFYYGTGTSEVAGIRWQDSRSKLAYLAFGLQNLSTTFRQQVITAFLNWADGTSAASATTTTTPVFGLGACYPNPISSSTMIPYSLKAAGTVRLTVVDVKGNEVTTLANDFESAGDHFVTFNSGTLAKGTYFYVIHTTDGSAMRAMSVE